MKKGVYGRGDKNFYLINNILLGLIIIATIYPIIIVVSSSFSSPVAVSTGKVWLFPVEFSLEGYKAIFKYDAILSGYANTIFYTFFGTIINIILTIMIAYPLSRKEFLPRNLLMFLITFTMLFNGGIIPNYILLSNLGMINTRWAMIIPNAIGVYNVIIARTFFQQTIPDDLWEVSRIDGCSHFKFIWHIVLPLSKPIIGVLTLFYAVQHWNAYFQAFIYLKDKELYPLQLILREILIVNSIDSSLTLDPVIMAAKQGMADLLKYSLIVVASVPILIIYPMVQKHFVKGVMVGSIKG